MRPRLLALIFHVFLNRQRDDPLAAAFVAGVLPLGADALLEHEEVGVGDYLGDHVDVVVHAPEVLYLYMYAINTGSERMGE